MELRAALDNIKYGLFKLINLTPDKNAVRIRVWFVRAGKFKDN